MSDASDKTMRQLQELRLRFREQLPTRIGRLEALWCELVGGGWPAATAREIQFLLHGLTGSAGTHGFPGVSGAAAKAEMKLDVLCASSGVPGDAQVLEMKQLLAELQEAVATEQPQSLVVSARTANAGRGLVYLVDDDEEFAVSTAQQLGNFGYEVRSFSNIDAFKAALTEKIPAAILVDIVFDGEILGTRAVEEMRASLPEIPPLVFISARNDFAARLGAVRAGCDGYFTKPLDVGMLVDCLDRLTGVKLEEPYRVMIVDDSPLDATAYSINLQHAGFETAIVTDPTMATARLGEFTPDLILMDLNMPECGGVDLAAVIRQQGLYLNIPIVFLSVEADRGRQLWAMQQGGDDFLTKPIRPEHLVALVRTRAERGRILGSAMVRDGLTGLLSHNRVKEQLAAEVTRAARYRSELAVAMIDIDHFKKVNDTHGHPAGDRVIKSLARMLQQCVRTTDIIGRYGGEEFIAILIGTPADLAREIMDKIRASFSAAEHRSGNGVFTVSFSCGIASFPQFGAASQLIDAADRALYEAKRAGRNLVVAYGRTPLRDAGATLGGSG